MSLSQQVDVFYRPIILEKTETIQSYGWADINLSYENAVNQNKKRKFVFVCGEIGEENTLFLWGQTEHFLKVEKSGGIFQCKVKNQYRKALEIIFL